MIKIVNLRFGEENDLNNPLLEKNWYHCIEHLFIYLFF